MPKAKTNKATKKRVRVTKTGKVKFRRNYTGHLMSGRSSRRRRHLRRRAIASKNDTKRILWLLGTGTA
jgi:large subunit ribosomal protein L35